MRFEEHDDDGGDGGDDDEVVQEDQLYQKEWKSSGHLKPTAQNS